MVSNENAGADKLITFGKMALEQGWYDQAREYLEQALALDAANPEAVRGLARANDMLNRMAAAPVKPVHDAEGSVGAGVDPAKAKAYSRWLVERFRGVPRGTPAQHEAWALERVAANRRRHRVGAESKRQVLARDNCTCRYCGKPLVTEVPHIDHVHPFSKGGETTIDNLVTACEDCNLEKGDLHGIIPLSLEAIERWKDQPELARTKSEERREILRREWQALHLDPAQHGRGFYFSLCYDRYMLRLAEGSVARSGDALAKPDPCWPDGVRGMDDRTELDAWIEYYMSREQ